MEEDKNEEQNGKKNREASTQWLYRLRYPPVS
jgi:hypothetical protein